MFSWMAPSSILLTTQLRGPRPCKPTDRPSRFCTEKSEASKIKGSSDVQIVVYLRNIVYAKPDLEKVVNCPQAEASKL